MSVFSSFAPCSSSEQEGGKAGPRQAWNVWAFISKSGCLGNTGMRILQLSSGSSPVHVKCWCLPRLRRWLTAHDWEKTKHGVPWYRGVTSCRKRLAVDCLSGKYVYKARISIGRSYYLLAWKGQLQEPAFPEADILYQKLSSHYLNCCHCLCLDSDLCWHSEFFRSESSKLSVFPSNIS